MHVVLETLRKAAYALHPETAEEREGWAMDRAEAILKLRSLKISGDWILPGVSFRAGTEAQLPGPTDPCGRERGSMKVSVLESDWTLLTPALSHRFWGTGRRFKRTASNAFGGEVGYIIYGGRSFAASIVVKDAAA